MPGMVDDDHDYTTDGPNLKLKLDNGIADADIFVDGQNTGKNLNDDGYKKFYVEPYPTSDCTVTVSDGGATLTVSIDYCDGRQLHQWWWWWRSAAGRWQSCTMAGSNGIAIREAYFTAPGTLYLRAISMSGSEACVDGNWLVPFSGDELETTIEGYFTHTCRVAVSSNGEYDDFGMNDCVPWEDTLFPTVIRADELHDQGIDGSGIGIAVVDTGVSGAFWDPDNYPNYGAVTVVHSYDAYNGIDNQGADGSGHGSHVSTIAASGGQAPNGKYNGVAPGAHIINVKAFDNYGQGSYDDVIAAIEWVLDHKSHLQHQGHEPVVQRRPAVLVLGGPHQPGGDGSLGCRHHGRRRGR